MSSSLKWRMTVLAVVAIAFTVGACQSASAADDPFHVVKGVVKSIDKDTKTMVVKAADGTEHSIKWTDKTATKTGKDVGDEVAKGSKVSVKYTEKAGEKTAVGVDHVAKDTAKDVK